MKAERTTLTVEIEYNPRKTDPEGLACAMDRLLETALSTPGILDDYGNPTIREFFVAKETTAPPAPKIVLNISGGVLQDVFGSDPTITVALVDWDTEGCDPSDNGIVEIPDGRGDTQLANVAEYPVLPLEEFMGTETEAALKAALLENLALKPRKAFGPIRVAATGSTVSPPLFESLELLGRDRSLARLSAGRDRAAAPSVEA